MSKQVHKYHQYLTIITQLVTRQGGANKTAEFTARIENLIPNCCRDIAFLS